MSFGVDADSCSEDLVAVALGLGRRIDPLDRQAVGGVVAERVGEVGGGVGGRECDLVAAVGERDRDRGCDRGLADPALAHRHHDSAPGAIELVDQLRQPSERRRG